MKSIKITESMIESDFQAKPDESINIKQLKEHFEKYPARWNTAFKFLIESDLKSIESGRIDLNDNVFATISEYETKNPEDANYESHRKYIDIQYLVLGEEFIGLTKDQMITVVSPYSETNDIIFYNYNDGELLYATPASYFIFFPEDIHRPCMKTKKKSVVKKIVVKIKYD